MAREKKQAAATGIGVGGSSILAVFVILCLTTFATLSLVSAQADLRLSRRAADSVTLYYQADAQAQQLLAQLAGSGQGTESQEQFVEKAAALDYVQSVSASPAWVTVEFAIPMDDTRQLSGTVFVTSTGQLTTDRYQVTFINPDETAPEGTLEVWDGQVPA